MENKKRLSAEIDAPVQAVIEVLSDHEMIPCSHSRPGSYKQWALCQGCDWASEITFRQDGEHHLREFRRHLAEVIVTRVISPEEG